MARAEAVARYLLHLAGGSEEPCPVTHMQLQKLMYYVQGWSLATTGRPAFQGRIEAWQHGPVVKPLFPKFASHKNRPIPAKEASDAGPLTADERALIESVWERYGQYSAPRLRAMTHAEAPWRDARGDLPEGEPSTTLITDESMKLFFESQHRKHCERLGIEPKSLIASIGHARKGNTTRLELPRGRGRVGR